MKTITIGFVREDGDLQVLCTLNNNDELINEAVFLAMADGLVRKFAELTGEEVSAWERQDAPDYVTFEEE